MKRNKYQNRDGLYRRGKTWWVNGTDANGVAFRLSSGSTIKEEAAALRDSLRVRSRTGQFRAETRTLTLADLEKLATARYQADGRRAGKRLALAWNALRAGLPELVRQISTQRVNEYEAARLAAGRARSTTNYELAALRRAFRLAVEARLMTADQCPVIHTPTPNNARQGIVTPDELRAILAALPDWARPVIQFLSLSGWRLSEALHLTWKDNVDQRQKLVRLEATDTKAARARTFPFGALPALERLLTAQRQAPGASQYVFVKDSRPIAYKALRKTWRAACRKARCVGKLMHDLRRSAATRMVEAGIDEHTVMALCGWETPSVFRRYHIIHEDAKRAALARLATVLEPVTVEDL